MKQAIGQPFSVKNMPRTAPDELPPFHPNKKTGKHQSDENSVNHLMSAVSHMRDYVRGVCARSKNMHGEDWDALMSTIIELKQWANSLCDDPKDLSSDVKKLREIQSRVNSRRATRSWPAHERARARLDCKSSSEASSSSDTDF